MLQTLLSHQWKQTRRSPVFQRSIVINLIICFFILYFALLFIFMGFHADELLQELYPRQSPANAFNSFLLFYFLVDLFVRFLLQELPVLAIQPYLHLPIRKSKLIHFVLLRSLPSVFNWLLLLVFVPFMVKVLVPAYGLGTALIWLASLLLLTLFNNFLLLYFKRQLSNKPMLTLYFGLAVGGLILLDYADVLSLKNTSAVAFGLLLQQPWLVVVPALLVAAAYSGNYRFLLAHTYPEEITIRKVTGNASRDLAFLHRFGSTGQLIALELKLIWRHKRSKSMILLSCLFLLYGLMFYRKENTLESFGMLLFVGIFMTGAPMLNYGQFMPGWQSAHFDALLTKPISPYHFYKAKFWLFVLVTFIVFLLTLPYGLYSFRIVLINLAAMLFNIGVNVFVIFYFSVLNRKRLDLSSSSSFNWQGVGASTFLLGLPLVLLPLLIYAPFGFTGAPYWGIFAIGLVGLTGFIFHRQLLHLVARRFLTHKYKLAAGFRQG